MRNRLQKLLPITNLTIQTPDASSKGAPSLARALVASDTVADTTMQTKIQLKKKPEQLSMMKIAGHAFVVVNRIYQHDVDAFLA